MNKVLIGLVIVVLGFAGGYYFLNNRINEISGVPSTMEESPEMAAADSTEPVTGEEVMSEQYSLADIANHATPDDCWFAIEDGVYDVTPFIASQKHPGGEAITLGCGKDATELFKTRPMGSGTPHSDRAQANLENYRIGSLLTDGSMEEPSL